MADSKVSAFTSIVGADVDVDNDKIYLVDTSAGSSGSKAISPKELIANTESFLQSGTAENETVLAWGRRKGHDVQSYGATGDGTTDDKAAIQKAIDAASAGDIIFFSTPSSFYKLDSGLSISGKSDLLLVGTWGTQLRFTDGSYTGIAVTGASAGVRIDNLDIRGTNTSTPALTLIDIDGVSANVAVTRCELSRAKILVSVNNAYGIKVRDNSFSACEQAIVTSTSEGSCLDILIQGNTFGTANISTNAVLQILSQETRIVGNYFETTVQTKLSVEVKTGTQRCIVSANQFQDSGGVKTETSNTLVLQGNQFFDSYDSANNRVVRVDGGANCVMSGNHIDFTSVVASVAALSSSGMTVATGNFVNKCAIAFAPASGVVMGNAVTGCTTALQPGSGSTGVPYIGNYLSSNTADINNAGGTNFLAFNYATTVTETEQGGTYFGNWPKQLHNLGLPNRIQFFDDFLGDAINTAWNSRVGSDPQVVAPAIRTGQLRGVMRMTTGDDAAASMAVNGVQLEADLNWRASEGGLVIEGRIQMDSTASVCVFFGLTDQAAALEMPFTLGGSDVLTSNASNAVGVLFDTAADTDNWWAVGVATDVDATKQNLAVAPSASTFEIFRIEITTAGVATFYRNGAVIGSAMTGAVTASVPLTPVFAAFSRTSASKNIDADYIAVQANR